LGQGDFEAFPSRTAGEPTAGMMEFGQPAMIRISQIFVKENDAVEQLFAKI
jgi:hypothetical protein